MLSYVLVHPGYMYFLNCHSSTVRATSDVFDKRYLGLFFFVCPARVLYFDLLLLYGVQFETALLNEKSRAVKLLNIFWL